MAKHDISIHNKLLKFEYQYICDITIRQESFNYSKINNFLVKISWIQFDCFLTLNDFNFRSASSIKAKLQIRLFTALLFNKVTIIN